MILNLPFLPGTLRLARGCWSDYTALSRFHYRPRDPRTWTQIWAIRYVADGAAPRTVAVAVVSYPTRHATGRRRALGIRGSSMSRELRYVNKHVRTISRVIVHPQFRSLGLASVLIRCVCKHCATRYLDASATMGRAHPLFDRGGMRRFEPDVADAQVYFLFERKTKNRKTRRTQRRRARREEKAEQEHFSAISAPLRPLR